MSHCHYTSLTRISPLRDEAWTTRELPRDEWATGDYVLCEAEVRGHDLLELDSGRMARIASGDLFIGALGDREATLEATGTWRELGADGVADVLTSAGLLGKLLSKSPFLPTLVRGHYRGHVVLGDAKATMARFAQPASGGALATPTVLLVGSSMSAGKTTAGQTVVRQLARRGYRVVAAKLTGAGRYRDILHMADAGAEWIFDFVDAGLPSTATPEDDYRPVLDRLLARTAAVPADVAVIEIGASPLAAYNGLTALAAIRDQLRLTLLAASDVYSVHGFEQLVGLRPDVVVGPAANTLAGVALVAEHTGIKALNLAESADAEILAHLLEEALPPPAGAARS
jgi:hypothetical protein